MFVTKARRTTGKRNTPSSPPTPGSDAALELGCRCAVLDNAHGQGYYGQPGVFVITAGCPVHDFRAKADALAAKTRRASS